jgi:hypothetical protein
MELSLDRKPKTELDLASANQSVTTNVFGHMINMEIGLTIDSPSEAGNVRHQPARALFFEAT